MENPDRVKEVSRQLIEYQLVSGQTFCTYQNLHVALSNSINHLINTNYHLLISLLYQLDISEEKLKIGLGQAKDTPAGELIATMIIELQLQKIEAKNIAGNNTYSGEERW